MVNGALTLIINLNERGLFFTQILFNGRKMYALGEKIGALGNKKLGLSVKMNALGNKNRDAW